jgi:hypothetical protein
VGKPGIPSLKAFSPRQALSHLFRVVLLLVVPERVRRRQARIKGLKGRIPQPPAELPEKRIVGRIW